MLFNTPESTNVDEIIKKHWPGQGSEASVSNDSDWEILTHNSGNDSSSRYWFKQNFINQMPLHNSMVTYH